MLQSLVYTNTHTQCQLGGVRERSYGEEQEFSPRDICILVRFNKYNTINRSCSGGGGGGRGEGEEGGRKAEKAVGERQESEEYQYGLIGMPAT